MLSVWHTSQVNWSVPVFSNFLIPISQCKFYDNSTKKFYYCTNAEICLVFKRSLAFWNSHHQIVRWNWNLEWVGDSKCLWRSLAVSKDSWQQSQEKPFRSGLVTSTGTKPTNFVSYNLTRKILKYWPKRATRYDTTTSTRLASTSQFKTRHKYQKNKCFFHDTFRDNNI